MKRSGGRSGQSCRAVLVISLLLFLLFSSGNAQDQKEPRVIINGPSGITFPELTFTASTENLPDDLKYEWTVSQGSVISGQGTPAITVRLDNPGQLSSITVDLIVTWNNGKNSFDAHLTQSICLPEPPCCRAVDEFGDTNNGEMMHRLDNFWVELQNDPNAMGYIVFTRSEKLPGKAARQARWILDLINFRKYDPTRFIVVDSGFDTELRFRLYAIPIGAPNPEFLNPVEINPAKKLTKSLAYDNYSIFDYLYGNEYLQKNRKKKDMAILRDFRQSTFHPIYLNEVADLLKENAKMNLSIVVSPEKGLTLNPLLFGEVERNYLVNMRQIKTQRISVRIGAAIAGETRITLILNPLSQEK